MRNDIWKICNDSGDLFASCVIAISKNGETEYLNYNCETDSIFDCASITKSMPTAYLALKAIENGDLKLNTAVKSILPEYENPDATIFNLLTHSLDYRFPMSSLKDFSPNKIWEKICTHKFEIPPGKLFNYGNANSIILGRVLEKIYNSPLDKLAKEKVFIPFGMNSTGWHPLEWADPARIIPTEICTWRGRELRGETHDESAWKLEKEFGTVGSAGVFSTAPDIIKFLDNIYGSSNFILDCLTKNAFLDSRLRGNDRKEHGNNTLPCTALGFELNNPKFMGNSFSKEKPVFGKTGFTGTSFICRPADKTALVILSNYTYPHRKPNADRINAFRAQMADLALT
ncbi:hypothetical protein AGMMS49938_04930 [Fibrobacterales bacterium]|nr:hypothetical protein AGMMS49938_04930 [Fibrobacterales bacterium]